MATRPVAIIGSLMHYDCRAAAMPLPSYWMHRFQIEGLGTAFVAGFKTKLRYNENERGFGSLQSKWVLECLSSPNLGLLFAYHKNAG